MTRWMHFFTAVVILTCLTGCQTPTSSPDDLTIQVDGGLISGIPVGSDGQVRAYKGIPYAAPPVGDLRWKPPQPAKGWDASGELINSVPCVLSPFVREPPESKSKVKIVSISMSGPEPKVRMSGAPSCYGSTVAR